MTASLFPAAISSLGLVAISALVLLTMLILRNPDLPEPLQNEAAAHAASLVLTTGVLVAVIYATSGLVAAELHYSVIIVVITGVLAGSAYVFWKLFNVGDRLARADAGQSPFARRTKAPATPLAAPEAAPAG